MAVLSKRIIKKMYCTKNQRHRPVVVVAVVVIFSFRIAALLAVELPWCFDPCSEIDTGNVIVPGTKCSTYMECGGGKVKARRTCTVPLMFDISKNYCNYVDQVDCPPDVPCGPSLPPTQSPVTAETETPTLPPVTDSPTASPVIGGRALEYIASKRALFQKYVLKSYTAAGVSYQSTLYTFDEFMTSLEVMGKEGFGADFQFFLFDSTIDYVYGLVNTAAFLANAMVESIATDSCDENNEEAINGRHAISNACGQYKRSYQDEKCEDEVNTSFSCGVDPNMKVTAVTAAPGARSPPPLMCKPGNNNAGYWDTNTGTPVVAAYSNSNGRTDVEGCCFWGRGALLTRNVCNLGKLNYYLGKGGVGQGMQNVLYPEIDFCTDPEAICSSPVADELRWRTGMFEWSDRVQRYSSEGWDYEDQLRQFVDGDLGYESLRNFITSTSRILSNGCHTRGCANKWNPDVEVRNLDDRIKNFDMILNTILEVKSLLALLAPKPVDPLPSPPNPTPTFSPDNNIEQTNPGPTIQLAPPTPQNPPSFFQPPTTPNIQSNPSPVENVALDDSNDMSNLIVLEDNSAFQIIGMSQIFMVSVLILALHSM